MRNITRRNGESIAIINDNDVANVKIFDIGKDRLKMGIVAPEHVEVCLTEIFKRKKAERAQELEAYYHQNRKEKESFLRVQSSQLTKPKILLIEDNEIIKKVNSVCLRDAGFEVDAAETGEDALEFFNNNHYGLVILDLNLPDMYGVEVLGRIRKFEQSQDRDKHTPVMVLTAEGNEAEKKCMEAGADDFYVKPLDLDKLEKVAKCWLRKEQE